MAVRVSPPRRQRSSVCIRQTTAVKHVRPNWWEWKGKLTDPRLEPQTSSPFPQQLREQPGRESARLQKNSCSASRVCLSFTEHCTQGQEACSFHILGHKANFNKFKRNEIIQCALYGHSGVKWEANDKNNKTSFKLLESKQHNFKSSHVKES